MRCKRCGANWLTHRTDLECPTCYPKCLRCNKTYDKYKVVEGICINCVPAVDGFTTALRKPPAPPNRCNTCGSETCASNPCPHSTPDKEVRIAWLHRANDNYYTDEQMNDLIDQRAKHTYLKFIEHSAYLALEAELAELKTSWKSYELDTIRRERDVLKIARDAAIDLVDSARTELEQVKAERDHARDMEQVAISERMSDSIIKNCVRRDVERKLTAANERARRLVEALKEIAENKFYPGAYAIAEVALEQYAKREEAADE